MLIYPSATVLDTFNRADGDLGASWTADFGGAGYAKPDVGSNLCKADSVNAFSCAYWNATTFGEDCEVFVDIPTMTAVNEIRIYARIQNPGCDSYSHT